MAFSVNATAAAALLLVTSFIAVPAVSQQLEMPSNEAIQKIMQEQAASRSAALNGKIDPVKAGTFKATVPVIDAPPPTKTESLDDVIARFNTAKDGAKGGHGANDFIIFVSFSMPKDKLEQLAQQARETGAVMVVRGFKNGSQMQTKQAALEVNKAGVPWEINPNLFKAFKVESVPTFVVASAEAESVLDDGCSPDATFTSITGDISAMLALDTIRLRAQPEIAKLAEARLQKIYKQQAPGSVH